MLTYEVKGGTEGEAAAITQSKDFARLCLSELLVQAEAGRSDKASGGRPLTGAAGGS